MVRERVTWFQPLGYHYWSTAWFNIFESRVKNHQRRPNCCRLIDHVCILDSVRERCSEWLNLPNGHCCYKIHDIIPLTFFFRILNLKAVLSDTWTRCLQGPVEDLSVETTTSAIANYFNKKCHEVISRSKLNQT